jgi:endo-1,4-beta-xylanase
MNTPIRLGRILCFCAAVAGLCGCASVYTEPPAWDLWPGGAAGLEDLAEAEKVVNRAHDQNAFGLNRSISQVTVPTVTVYLPARRKAAAVVICPGGGFTRIVIDKEGHDIARWLNRMGVAGIVLKYRTGSPGEMEALADVQRAIRLVRSRAVEFHVRPDRIGVMGFSAGGFIAIRAATEILPGDPSAADPVERVSSRPDFFAPIYPAVPRDAVERVTSNTPPAFLTYTFDDGVPRSEGVKLYEALSQVGVPTELHIYAQGGHGYGMGIHGGPVATWPMRFIDWLNTTSLVDTD